MLSFDALVRGRVNCEGHDMEVRRIPRGRCAVEANEGFVSIAWIEDGEPRNTVLTAEAFEAALEAGAIMITGTAQTRMRPDSTRQVPHQ